MRKLWQLATTVLHYDLFPWFNRWISWIRRPAASLSLAAAAALACAVLGKPAAFIALGAVALVVGLGSVWPSLAIRGLSATMGFPRRRVMEGEAARAVVRIVNRWPWPVWGIEVSADLGSCESVALAYVAGWSTTEFSWEFVPLCRGEFPVGLPQLATGFPFGLRRASRPVVVRESLLVWPQIIALETLIDAAETRPSDSVFSDHRTGDSGDMLGTRPFRAGDSMRCVHWAQTARTGRMIVCERQAPARSAIRVLFDSDPRLHRGEGGAGTLEWSIRIAASVCLAYHRENAPTECCFGPETLPVLSGTLGRVQFLDALARWQPARDGHDPVCLQEHASRPACRKHRDACGLFQVMVTTDLGFARRAVRLRSRSDRMIVLKTSAFNSSCEICGEIHPMPHCRTVTLDRADTIADDFARKWRHLCHVG